MAITIDWATKVISVPKADLTFISGTLYELDTNWFRKELKALEAGVYGIVNQRTHIHTTEVAVAGVTYARFVEIINGYSVEFEDDPLIYSIRIVGSNNKIFDVENGILVPNHAHVVPTNAAGLIVVNGTGGGEVPPDLEAQLDAIQERTDRIPDNPASAGDTKSQTFNANVSRDIDYKKYR